jgi:L-lactate dehydrogenase complex protein LldF
MSELDQPPGRFRTVAQTTLANDHVEEALDTATARLYGHRLEAWGALDDVQTLREQGREIKTRTIKALDEYLDAFQTAVEARGGHVHRCADAAEARAKITEICKATNAKLVAKSKSMATEEIGLNEALEGAGMEVVETDLGEWILQLAGEHPVHIVAPAIEKTAGDVAELFSQLEGSEVPDDLASLTLFARGRLREVFTRADVGITGANFAVAETGSICIIENEGNARLVSALPRVHISLVGMERLVPTTAELSVLLRLLARSATGQKLSSYTTLISGPRRPGEVDGPEELHIVILDNGRSNLRGTRYEEMLNCIRCGACLNVCPIYRKAGGGAYGPVYSGPMGAVLVPLLVGLEQAPALPHASSLCGACTDACPVKIPLHDLLLDLRDDLVGTGVASRWERLAFTAWSFAWSSPLGYRVSTALARLGQPLSGLAGPGRVWAQGRTFPKLSRRYRDRR